MRIMSTAQAGTFESSDILILVEPGENGRKVEIDSSVLSQYGDSVLEKISKILDKYQISDIHLIAKDKGALSCTIAARTETAIKRSIGAQKGTSYGTY